MKKSLRTAWSVVGGFIAAALLTSILMSHFAVNERQAAAQAAIAEGYSEPGVKVISTERSQGPLFGAFGETVNAQLVVTTNDDRTVPIDLVLRRSPWSTRWTIDAMVVGD